MKPVFKTQLNYTPVRIVYLEKFHQTFYNVYDTDEGGKYFFSESCKYFHKYTALHTAHKQCYDEKPYSNVYPHCKVLNAVSSTHLEISQK